MGWGIYRLTKQLKNIKSLPEPLRIIVTLSTFLLWFGIAFWQVTGKKSYWDAQVNQKCEIDGGIKVYETIELPSDSFDRWGLVNFYRITDVLLHISFHVIH
jgi:hypothetical protein